MKNNIKKYSLMVLVVGSLIVVGCGDSNNKEELLESTPIVSEAPSPTLSPETEEVPEASIEPTVLPTSTPEPISTPKPTSAAISTPKPTSEPISTPKATSEPEIEENDTIPVVGEVDPTMAQESVYVATNGVELPDGGEMSRDMFARTYGMPTDILSSYYIHIPIDSAYATEVAVFQIKNMEDKQMVIKGIEKRQQGLLTKFKNTSKEEYNMVVNYRTAEKGNEIIFVISKDADKIINQFLGM